METRGRHIVCFGETLWDALPNGLFLGGAPYNVAYHLARLGQRATLVTAVGDDELGRLARARAVASGIDDSCFQISGGLPTGIADVTIDSEGNADYEIRQPAAWDGIRYDEQVEDAISSCQALVFGCLASRSEASRSALLRMLRDFQGIAICDLNLRKTADDPSAALDLARRAHTLKLNEDELRILANDTGHVLSLEAAITRVFEATKVQQIFVTRAGKPAAYFAGDETLYATPPPDVVVADTVGAGDAFTAAIASGLLDGLKPMACLERGVRLGSFVASQQGAQPRYDASEVLSE